MPPAKKAKSVKAQQRKTKKELKNDATSHDRNFKELIGNFTLEFLQLFVPEVLKYLEPTSLVPLDKEVFTDIAVGEKHEVDLIFRAKFKPKLRKAKDKTQASKVNEAKELSLPTKAKEAFFIIHIEAQSTHRTTFPRRMFIYFSRLTEKYNQPVYPIAIFSFDNLKSAAANRYVMKFPNKTVLQFDYDTIQLNQLDWHNYVNNPNPVASALMAKMKIAPEDRPIVKLQCLKMLVGLELDPAKAHLITGFINTYLKLDQQQKQVFEAELEKLQPSEEKEQVMQVMNEWIEEGIERGIEQGRQEERLNIISRQLSRKIGQPLSVKNQNRLRELSEDKLLILTDALLDFNTLQDLTTWLDNNASK